jgi:predicted transcriptional regulator
MLVEPDLNHLFEPPKELVESLEKTTEVRTFYSYFCPSCPKNYSYLAKKGTNFTLILTKSVYERLRDEFQTEYHTMMNSESSNIFICDDNIKLGAVSVTDDLVLLAFFNKEGMFDHRKLLSFDKRAHKWGIELFDYYKSISEQVK